MDGHGGVVVDGWGPVAEELAAQLRRVRCVVRAGGHAADAAELEVAAGGPVPAAVVLVVGAGPARWDRAPSTLAPWHAARVPHLPVIAGPDGVVVGPLVVPGRSPCLACASSAGTGRSAPAPGPTGGSPDPAATVLAAAVVTVIVLAVTRGDTSPAGISTEIGPAGTTVVHRVWTSRPGCGCASVRMAG